MTTTTVGMIPVAEMCVGTLEGTLDVVGDISDGVAEVTFDGVADGIFDGGGETVVVDMDGISDGVAEGTFDGVCVVTGGNVGLVGGFLVEMLVRSVVGSVVGIVE